MSSVVETRNPLKISRIGLITVCLCVLTACNGRPRYVLSDSKMENVLFDLHLAENVISDNYMIFSGDSVRKQQLLNSVFDKHKITEQTFDTSLVWYNAHLDKYLKINANLSQRYANLLAGLQAQKEKMKPKVIAKVVLPKNYVELLVRDTLRLFPVTTIVSDQKEVDQKEIVDTIISIPLRRDSGMFSTGRNIPNGLQERKMQKINKHKNTVNL
jgi:hypothetical protein